MTVLGVRGVRMLNTLIRVAFIVIILATLYQTDYQCTRTNIRKYSIPNKDDVELKKKTIHLRSTLGGILHKFVMDLTQSEG